MFRKLIIAGIFSFSFLCFAKAPATYSQVRSEILKVSQKELIYWVNSIVSNSLPSRMIGQPGHVKTRAYLMENIKKLDPKSSGTLTVINFTPDVQEIKNFYQKDFQERVEGKISKVHPDYAKYKNFVQHASELADRFKTTSGENIIWEKTGIDTKKMLVITAHYDTISFDQATYRLKENDSMPGANYNASGMSVALGLIKILSSIDLNYSVQVVFLDWQGLGYLGSRQHAMELKNSGKNIMGVINLEMLGQDTSFFDKTKKTGNMCLYVRKNPQEEKWAASLIAHGKSVNDKVSFELRPNNFDQSDTFRFWEKDFLAATFSQNWEEDFNPKFYQTPLDTPETLNHETLYKSYQYIGGAVLGTLLDITK